MSEPPPVLRCRNHGDLTATHTANMATSTPPYRENVPLCAMCAPRIEAIGFVVTPITSERSEPSGEDGTPS